MTAEVVKKVIALDEIDKERTMGEFGTEIDREVRIIDLSDFDNRKVEIADQLWNAARDIGFFQVTNHGIPHDHIDGVFENSNKFFHMPLDVKKKYPNGKNAGFEYMSQIRPSTGTVDHKESYQITDSKMKGKWPSEEELPGFKSEVQSFEKECYDVGNKILACFAYKLGMPSDYFKKALDPKSDGFLSTLRLIHYLPLTEEELKPNMWRAGAHTDFDALTLLFQRDGQFGLQVCPGDEYAGHAWTSVTPTNYIITCNIGDQLMRWSDDELPSNFHRVRSPHKGEYLGSRYSVAYFLQADEDAMIQGPKKKYPLISGKDYMAQQIAANYSGRY